jgi:acetyl-CoA carboxylase biotin carboxyl carrier protein
MKTQEIKDLIKLIDETNIAEVKIEQEGFKLLIRSEAFFKGRQEMAPIIHTLPAPAPTGSAVPVAAPTPAPTPAAAPVQVTAMPTADTAESHGELLEIKSPMVGTFYRSPSPDKAAFVQVGDSVKSGDVVCIIEAMKLFNEIESEVTGKIVKVMVADAAPVEYDQVLFLVDPAG